MEMALIIIDDAPDDAGRDVVDVYVDHVLRTFDGRHRPLTAGTVGSAERDRRDGETLAAALARRESAVVARVDETWFAANSSAPVWARTDTDTALLAPSDSGPYLRIARTLDIDVDLVAAMPYTAVLSSRADVDGDGVVELTTTWHDLPMCANVPATVAAHLRARPQAWVCLVTFERAAMWDGLVAA